MNQEIVEKIKEKFLEEYDSSLSKRGKLGKKLQKLFYLRELDPFVVEVIKKTLKYYEETQSKSSKRSKVK